MLRFGASEDTTKFLTFDLKTQKWTDLAAGTFVNWAVSQDGKYLHFTTGGTELRGLRQRNALALRNPRFGRQ